MRGPDRTKHRCPAPIMSTVTITNGKNLNIDACCEYAAGVYRAQFRQRALLSEMMITTDWVNRSIESDIQLITQINQK